MFLLDEIQTIDSKRRESTTSMPKTVSDGESEGGASVLDLTSETMGGVEI
jgi:hypothetical protein